MFTIAHRSTIAQALHSTTSAPEQDVSTTLESLPQRYFEIALSLRTMESLQDGTWFAEIPEFDGLYGTGASMYEASTDLASALSDWVFLKVKDRDGDIPVLDGIDLNNG